MKLVESWKLNLPNRAIFNALKAEYLSYFRDISLLCKKDAEASGSNLRRKNTSPPSYSKRKRSASPARWERKAQSPSPQRWKRKPLSPSPVQEPRKVEPTELDYPRGCIVFLKRFDPKVSSKSLKTLLRAILEREEVDIERLEYVEHVRNVDSVSYVSASRYDTCS